MPSERKPPSLPRRKRSQLSNNASGPSGNQQSPSPPRTARTRRINPLNSREIVGSPSNSIESPLSRSAPSKNSMNERQLASKLDAVSLNSNSSGRILTEAGVRAFLTDYYEDYGSTGESGLEAWCLFFERYFSPNYVHVRPSGNPIDSLGLAKMFSTDVKCLSISLVSIDAITIMASRRGAVVLYTTDQIFIYKGILNQDRAIVTCIMEYQGDELKIIHEHRTEGTPIPKESRWSSAT